MAQQTSPFIEGKWGWNLGESGWNSGMDENLIKFSYLFDSNVNAIVTTLPPPVTGEAYFLSTENRIYFVVGGTYYSTPVPKWFTFTIRSSGDLYQFDGTSTNPLDSSAQLDSRLDVVETTKAPLISPSFSGTPLVPDQTITNETAQAINSKDTVTLLGQKSFRTVSSLAELRTLDKTRFKRAFLTNTGYSLPYLYDPTDTTSVDNASSVVVGLDGGRWKQVTNGATTNKIYQEQGSLIHRFGDRVFVGGATLNNGTNQGSQPDWLTQFFLGKGRTFAFQQVTQQAVLTTISPDAANSFLAAAQTIPFTAIGNAIGVIGVAINNNTTYATGAYGGYFEGFNVLGSLGPTYGIEIDTANYNSLAVIDPYQQNPKQVVGLQLGSGAEFYGSNNQFSASAAINIRNNGSNYLAGIVFGSDAIAGTDGTGSNTGVAISFARGHTMQWYAGTGAPTSSVTCIGSSTSTGLTQIFNDNQVHFLNAAGKLTFQAFSVTNAVNYVSIRNSVTATPVQILARGDDTDIDVQIVPKGAGLIRYGTYTAGTLSTTGYISIRDSSSTIRRLLVG